MPKFEVTVSRVVREEVIIEAETAYEAYDKIMKTHGWPWRCDIIQEEETERRWYPPFPKEF